MKLSRVLKLQISHCFSSERSLHMSSHKRKKAYQPEYLNVQDAGGEKSQRGRAYINPMPGDG